MHPAPVRGPRCWLLNFRNQMMLPSRLSPQIAHEPRDLKPTLNVVTLEIGLAQYCFYGLSACATHFEGRKRSDSGARWIRRAVRATKPQVTSTPASRFNGRRTREGPWSGREAAIRPSQQQERPPR